MAFSESYNRTIALETALEWMLLRLVSTSNDPKATLADFEKHMMDREEATKAMAMEQLLAGRTDVWSNANEGVHALAELREALVSSVKVPD